MLDFSMEFALSASMLFVGLVFSAAILGALVFVVAATVRGCVEAVKALQNRKKRGSK